MNVWWFYYMTSGLLTLFVFFLLSKKQDDFKEFIKDTSSSLGMTEENCTTWLYLIAILLGCMLLPLVIIKKIKRFLNIEKEKNE